MWHYLEVAIQLFAAISGFLALIQSAKQGEFRRVWNWPMRFAVMFLLLFGLLTWSGAWVRTHSSSIGNIGSYIGIAAIIALNVFLISLCVFLAGFLIMMMRDLKPENRTPPEVDDIDKVQNLLFENRTTEAVYLYQEQNKVSLMEAEDAIEAMSAAIKAGLRI